MRDKIKENASFWCVDWNFQKSFKLHILKEVMSNLPATWIHNILLWASQAARTNFVP